MLTTNEVVQDVLKVEGFKNVYLVKGVYGGKFELTGQDFYEFFWLEREREIVSSEEFHAFGSTFKGFFGLTIDSNTNFKRCKGHFSSVEDALVTTVDDIKNAIDYHIQGLMRG